MTISVEIKGLKEMDEALRGLGAELGAKTLRGALRDAAKPLEDFMQSNAPISDSPRTFTDANGQRQSVLPGYLKSKIKRRTMLNKKGVNNKKFQGESVAVVQTGAFKVPYVTHVEFGTRNNPASNFIRGAASRRSEVEAIFIIRLKRKIELARKRLAKVAK